MLIAAAAATAVSLFIDGHARASVLAEAPENGSMQQVMCCAE
jgi:hypothetical protein